MAKKWLREISSFFGVKKCENSGYFDNYVGGCRCTDYFNGTSCENIICLHESKPSPDKARCLCRDDDHYSGRHCENLLCENDGRPLPEGSCRCPASYSGKFCETYSNPWGIVIGCVAGILLLFVLIWMICQWYWSKREFDSNELDSDSGDRLSRPFQYRYRNRYRDRCANATGVNMHSAHQQLSQDPLVTAHTDDHRSNGCLSEATIPNSAQFSPAEGISVLVPPPAAAFIALPPPSYAELVPSSSSSAMRPGENRTRLHSTGVASIANPTEFGGLPASSEERTQVHQSNRPATPPPSYDEAVSSTNSSMLHLTSPTDSFGKSLDDNDSLVNGRQRRPKIRSPKRTKSYPEMREYIV